MKVDFKGILEGGWNSIFIKDSIEKVHKERLSICTQCQYNSEKMRENGYRSFRPDFHCTLCGCNLDMKTRCMACECPIKKWEALTSEEEEKEIISKIEEDDKESKS